MMPAIRDNKSKALLFPPDPLDKLTQRFEELKLLMTELIELVPTEHRAAITEWLRRI